MWRKPLASIFNMALIEGLTYPFDSLPLTISLFFIYSLGTDLIFGRCPGMMLAGSHWIGRPTPWQKAVYSLSYTSCFALLFTGGEIAALVAASQIVSVLVTGKTTHGLLARMNSA